MVIQKNKGQSLLEYAILLSVVVAALLVMQFIVKRGVEGGLKDNSEKMGERYSLANGTTRDVRTMTSDQVITDKSGTNSSIAGFLPVGYNATGPTNILASGVLEHVDRRGGAANINSTVNLDSVKAEQVRWSGITNTTYADPAL